MKYKILNFLRNKNDYVSGEEIGAFLGVSRTAIWKNISKLKDMGYNIESVNNKGYRLIDDGDVVNEYEINYDNIIYKAKIDSTNEECKRQANNGCKSGLLVTCDNQTAGKGRLGRSWSADSNKGLYMSMVLRPNIMPPETPQITLVAGIVLRRIIEKMTNCDVKIKWPNDIIINGKKLVGILTEMSAEMEKVNYIVLGMGVNVNTESYDGELKDKATSMFIETGKKFKRKDVINEFINEFLPSYNLFCEKGFEAFKDEYNKNCANVGKEVKTVGPKNEIQGIAKGVDSKGELIIETDNGPKTVFAGEVSLRLSNNKYI